jgi:hypothetical protein
LGDAAFHGRLSSWQPAVFFAPTGLPANGGFRRSGIQVRLLMPTVAMLDLPLPDAIEPNHFLCETDRADSQ